MFAAQNAANSARLRRHSATMTNQPAAPVPQLQPSNIEPVGLVIVTVTAPGRTTALVATPSQARRPPPRSTIQPAAAPTALYASQRTTAAPAGRVDSALAATVGRSTATCQPVIT